MSDTEPGTFIFRKIKVGDVIIIAKGYGHPVVKEDTQAVVTAKDEFAVTTSVGYLGVLDAPGVSFCKIQKYS